MTDPDKAANLLGQIPQDRKKGPPPVHLWNPPFCGDLDMRIARDGRWYYMGTPIGRPAMVRLFSSVIRRDGEDYFLVTPVEKVGIQVEDVPFVATRLEVEGEGEAQVLRFFTHVEDEVEAGPEHPMRFEIDPRTQEPAPYVHVRANLEGADPSQCVLSTGGPGGALRRRWAGLARGLEWREVFSDRPSVVLRGAASGLQIRERLPREPFLFYMLG